MPYSDAKWRLRLSDAGYPARRRPHCPYFKAPLLRNNWYLQHVLLRVHKQYWLVPKRFAWSRLLMAHVPALPYP